MREMSASTPPRINEETRIELPDEAQIPLPPSPTGSDYGDDNSPKSRPATAKPLIAECFSDAEIVVEGSTNERSTMPGDDTDVAPTEGAPATISTPASSSPLPIPLLELMETIQEDKYESRRLGVLQDEAYGLFHKCGSCDRFLTVQVQLYRRMVECFHSDKKNAFAALYHKAMSYPSFGDLKSRGPIFDDDDLGGLGLESDLSHSDTSWIDRLPAESRKGLMDFISSVRSDPSFVADRISRLSPSQLKRLVQPHRPQGNESLFQSNQAYGRYDSRGFHRHMAKPSEPNPSVEDLMGDPLLLLIHGVFDSSSDQDSRERLRQLDVWSSVCSRLVEEGKPGSDEFCITILNAFAESPKWSIEPRLELFLAELVATGGPLLEAQAGQTPNFTQMSNVQQLENSIAVSNFFDQALVSLLDLVGDASPSGVPAGALNLIRCVLDKINNQERKITARNFFFLRWYCASFLFNALVYPENHGIMMDHQISNHHRQSIFRELVMRLQKVISDVLAPWSSNPVSPVLEVKVRHLLSLFEEPGPIRQGNHRDAQIQSGRLFLFLRPEDVLTMAKALFPEGYSESSRNSMFEQPPSRPTSVFAYPGSTLSGIGEPQSLGGVPGATIVQSNTWHGRRPSIINSAYGTLDRGNLRPGSSGGLLGDMEKESSLPFTHDLWMLTANRDFQGPYAGNRQEVAVIFIHEGSSALSSEPFQEPIYPTMEIDVSGGPSPVLELEERMLLAAALARLAESRSILESPSLKGPCATVDSLAVVLEGKMMDSKSQFDFQAEYFWWSCLQVLKVSDTISISRFLISMAGQRKARVSFKRAMSEQYDDWLYVLRSRSTLQDQMTQSISLSSKRLRNKMWFVSDVRHSSAYEDAYNIMRALKAMAEPNDQRQSGVAAWAKQRIRSSLGHERALSQMLELMTAPKTYGGPNKLSESQVEITTGWLLHESIENFCRGEERIHRFCYEIQKCVKRLAGDAMLDSPVLWSSPLYQNEKAEHGIANHSSTRHSHDRPSWRTDFSYPQWQPGAGSTVHGANPSIGYPGSDTIGQPASPSSLHSVFDNTLRTPVQTIGNSQNYGRPQIPRNWMLPPSPISPGNVKTSTDGASLRRRAFLQNLRTHLTSLLLCDLGPMLWSNGSETDKWMAGIAVPPLQSTPFLENSAATFGHSEAQQESLSVPQESSDTQGYAANLLENLGGPLSADQNPPSNPFPFLESFKVLLQRFQLTPDPQTKLQHLYELFLLVGYSTQSTASANLPQAAAMNVPQDKHRRVKSLTNLGVGVPRTRLTRLQEVIANCEDRRLACLSNSRSAVFTTNAYSKALPNLEFDSGAVLAAIRMIFADPAYRPSTFFRDLQYIAAFTPSSTLDYTPQGTAFWTIGRAAMEVKSDRSRSMTDDAMQILDFHYGNGNSKEPMRTGQSPVRSSSVSKRKLSQNDLQGTTVRDAASLLTVSALEGDPTAARELALFHLTHPELVSRVTLPLSRPSDVFRAKHGGLSERGHRSGGDESSGLDSITFAVVFHWMEFAANAGDTDAITFFRENKDLSKAL